MGRKREKNDAVPPETKPETELEAEGTTEGTDGDQAEVDPIEAMRAERDDWKDRYHRALADAENARKRNQRERTETRQYAVTEIARDLVNVLDNLERAVAGIPEGQTDDPIATGVRLVLDQFLSTLKTHGVETISALGEPFDPMSHEAIQQEDRDDVAPGTVVEELMTGYRLADRLLRASVVKVARAPVPATETAEEDDAESPKNDGDAAGGGPSATEKE